ncbi:hypothetical protein RVR_8383 [Actinacidiphila reveromycinica]|uniref:Uncharacterized protein n=1 Tax=Actinacidiphila reveromycinica TaxID=659352 RepID=A0A7U3UYI1_9ACTN|nr:hypothetical protein RVR_8383 [Streptomyces sp. SN-593]
MTVTAGGGRSSLTLVRGSAALRDAARAAAYRAYLDHGHTCPLCPDHASRCDTAGDLWAAYRLLCR